jgi:hypothetical protein
MSAQRKAAIGEIRKVGPQAAHANGVIDVNVMMSRRVHGQLHASAMRGGISAPQPCSSLGGSSTAKAPTAQTHRRLCSPWCCCALLVCCKPEPVVFCCCASLLQETRARLADFDEALDMEQALLTTGGPGSVWHLFFLFSFFCRVRDVTSPATARALQLATVEVHLLQEAFVQSRRERPFVP